MNARTSTTAVLLIAGLLLVVTPTAAPAYGGPGSVVSGIGALLAAVAAIVAAIFGFLWFPLKRLLKTLRSENDETAAANEQGSRPA